MRAKNRVIKIKNSNVLVLRYKINLIFGVKKFLNAVKARGQKERFSKSKINTPRVFIQSTNVPNFNMIGQFLTSRLPQSFKEKRVPRAQKARFLKIKHPRYSSNLQVCRIST